jgi:hypothetical protein
MAAGLVEKAVQNLSDLLTDETETEDSEYRASFFKFAVEQVYLRPEAFGLEADAAEDAELGFK